MAFPHPVDPCSHPALSTPLPVDATVWMGMSWYPPMGAVTVVPFRSVLLVSAGG